MQSNKCNCPVCKGRDINSEGIKLAETEIIPFIKNELLKLPYPNHPSLLNTKVYLLQLCVMD